VGIGTSAALLQAREHAARLESEALAANSAALSSRDVTVGALLAREAWQRLPDSATTRSNLVLALSRNLQVAEFDVGKVVTGYVPSPDGGVALVLTDRVWLREGDRIRALRGLQVEGPSWQQFNCAAWAPDGQSCLVAVHGAVDSSPPRVGFLARLARDGARLPVADPVFPGTPNLSYAGLGAAQVIAALADGTFVVGDVRGGLRAIGQHGETVAHWTSPGAPEQIAFVGALSGGPGFVTVDANGAVLRWDRPAGMPTLVYTGGRPVSAVFATDGTRQLAVGDVDGRIHVVAPATGTHLATVRFEIAKPIEALAMTLDGSALFASAIGQRTALWDLAAEPRLVVQNRSPQLVRGAAFAPGGDCVAFTDLAGRLVVVDRRGRELLDIGAHRTAPYLVHFTDSRTLVTAGHETIVREWRLDAPGFTALRAHDYPALNVAWSPDGASIVSTGADNRLVWTAVDGTRIDAYAYAGQGLLWAMALSPDGQQVVVGGERLSPLRRLRLERQQRRMLELEAEVAPRQWNAAAWRDTDSVVFATVGGTVFAHDFVRGEKSTEWRHPDGSQAHSWGTVVDVARDGSIATASEDGGACLWRADGALERTLCTDPGGMTSVALSPDGSVILVGMARGRLRAFDRQGAVLRDYEGALGQVFGARFAPNGTFVAAVSSDSQLLVWRASGTPWLRVPLPALPTGLAFSPDGEQVAVACHDGAVHVWPVSEARIAKLAGAIFRELTPAERQSFLGR
ncbi:MAG: WD40 repeat domain-containing protein, partial [Planctomycetota bacterium]